MVSWTKIHGAPVLMQQCSSNDCDVIIVNYNAGVLISKCVQSVLDSNVRHVFVVDNGSHDDSLDSLSASYCNAPVTLIRNERNLGFASACNIGVRSSTAEFLLFLNPDSILTDGSLSCMMGTLKSDPSIGMVGGLLCNPDGSEQPGGRRVFPTPRRALMRAFGLSYLSKWLPSIFSDFLLHREPLPDNPTPVEAISGACMLVKREALRDVGLWDEGYFLHCEDLDWCMRFSLMNWRVVFVPGARIFHMLGACSRSRPFFVEWHKHNGMLRFYNKFFRKRYSGLLWVGVVLCVWLRFCLVSIYFATRLLKGRIERAARGAART